MTHAKALWNISLSMCCSPTPPACAGAAGVAYWYE